MTSLKITDLNQPVDFAKLEEAVLTYWDETDAFNRSVNERPADKPFVFYDGPPFATGLPHYGHIVASTTKDVIPRYYTMKGFRVERKWGWDCHGLPIENIIEKELNLKDRQAIVEYGIANFNQACKLAVLRYAKEWKLFIKRLGRWVDMENDYKTMDISYMESLWWVFKQLWERHLIYRGHKSMHICPRCGTPLSNFEVTQGYKEVKDISVFVKFLITNPEKIKVEPTQSLYLLAWTTTPWTLPGNMLLAINPDITYLLFKLEEGTDWYIAAKDRIEEIVEQKSYQVIQQVKGNELIGLTYTPIFPYYQSSQNAFRTVPGSFVTTDEGTGIVHIAPAFGEDDYQVGQNENVPFVQHVSMDGTFKPEVTDFAGLPVKPKNNPLETDIKLLRYLEAHQALFRKQNITHTYPHCWRCDTPLINYATDSWFIKVKSLKTQLLENNENIKWIPEHIKHGRFGKWLEGARDWAISRNRFWGTPLPIWVSDDGKDVHCIGSITELETLSGEKVTNLHSHLIDTITFSKNGKTFHRIPEVLDCWFESGAMPYASFHYPFENKEKFEASFPAEFISEGQDQTRGWFYTLHVLATALTVGENPAIPVSHPTSSFKNVIVNGIVLAEDGKKMSKRLNNYPDPMIVAEKYGIDSLRLYLMNSPVMRAENLNFSEKGVEDVKRKTFTIMWNVFKFYAMFDDGKAVYGFPQKPVDTMDAWLVSITENLTKDVIVAMDGYDLVTATRVLMDYVQEISTWYVRRSRERLRQGNSESLQILRTALLRWSLLMAPFAPFFTEIIYQNLPGKKCDSIHLDTYPVENGDQINRELEMMMNTVRLLVEKAHAVRKEIIIPVRQPLSKLIVKSPSSIETSLYSIIADEINVKEVVWEQGSDLYVKLDSTITPELKAEGEAREIIRKILDERKKNHIGLMTHIIVELPSWPVAHEAAIKQKVLAQELRRAKTLNIIKLS